MVRFKFLELLVRVAESKYKDTMNKNSAEYYAALFEKLMKEVILEHAPYEPMQNWRENELWTLEVNDVMKVNLDGIHQLYKRYLNPKQNTLHKNNIMLMFTRDTNLVSINEALYCYGLSKMTVIDETKLNKLYDRMIIPEFVEMIGRVADVKFKNQTMLGLS